MSTVNLRFVNRQASPKETNMEISRESVPQVMAWYGGYHSGDSYAVYVDGVRVNKDPNGELVGALP